MATPPPPQSKAGAADPNYVRKLDQWAKSVPTAQSVQDAIDAALSALSSVIRPARISVLDSGGLSRAGFGDLPSPNTVNPGGRAVYVYAIATTGAGSLTDLTLAGLGLAWTRIDAAIGNPASAAWIGVGAGSSGVLTFTISGSSAVATDRVTFVALQGLLTDQVTVGETGADAAFASSATSSPSFAVTPESITDALLVVIVHVSATAPALTAQTGPCTVFTLLALSATSVSLSVFVAPAPGVLPPMPLNFLLTSAAATNRRAHWLRLKYTG